MHRLEDNAVAVCDDSESFVDYQTRMVTAAKEIARLAQDMVSTMFIGFVVLQYLYRGTRMYE